MWYKCGEDGALDSQESCQVANFLELALKALDTGINIKTGLVMYDSLTDSQKIAAWLEGYQAMNDPNAESINNGSGKGMLIEGCMLGAFLTVQKLIELEIEDYVYRDQESYDTRKLVYSVWCNTTSDKYRELVAELLKNRNKRLPATHYSVVIPCWQSLIELISDRILSESQDCYLIKNSFVSYRGELKEWEDTRTRLNVLISRYKQE